MPRSQAEREKVIQRDRVCQICGKGPRDGTILHVHHVKKLGMGHRRKNDTSENMIALCPYCHSQVEAGKWKITSLTPLVVLENGVELADLYRNFKT